MFTIQGFHFGGKFPSQRLRRMEEVVRKLIQLQVIIDGVVSVCINKVPHCHVLIYCIFALLITNSDIIGKLVICDLNNWIIQDLL